MAVTSYRKEYLTRIWSRYFGNIEQPEIISGNNKTISISDNKCFTYICTFIGFQERAININNDKGEYSILLIENVFSNGPGTIYVKCMAGNIVIDKFCSFENRIDSDGNFANCIGGCNVNFLRGSISAGENGNGNRNGMIFQQKGNSSLSNTNISNCFSGYGVAFKFDQDKSPSKVSFCNFESLNATSAIVTYFSRSEGSIENCNYINNSQRLNYGLVQVNNKNLDILKCSFENNSGGILFVASSGQIYIYHCSIDNYTESKFTGVISTVDMTTDPFKNDLKFYELGQCEGYHKIFHYPPTHPITPVVPSNRRR